MSAAGSYAAPRSPAPLPFAALVAAAGAGIGVLAPAHPRLTLAAALLGVVAVMALAWPDAATPLVVFLTFSNIPAVAIRDHGAPVLLGAVVPIVLVLPLVARMRRGLPLRFNAAFGFLIALLAVELLSTMQSEFRGIAAGKVQTFVLEGVVLYGLVLNVVRTPAALRRALYALLAAATMLALITLMQKATGTFSRPYWGMAEIDPQYFAGRSAEPRASGPIGDPNYFAQLLLVAVPIGLLAVARGRGALRRGAALTATFIVLLGMMLTFSRGAALGLAVVLMLMATLGYLRARHVGLILAGAILLLVAVPQYGGRVMTLTGVGGATAQSGAATEADQSSRGRAGEMLAAAHVFADHPLLGVGPAVFPQYYQRYASQLNLEVHETTERGERAGEEAQRQAHNMLLSQAAELGIAGILAFGGLLVVTVRDLVRARRRWRSRHPELAHLCAALLLGVAAYLTTGLFLTLAFERFFWLLLALAGAATMLRPDDETARPERVGPSEKNASHEPLYGRVAGPEDS